MKRLEPVLPLSLFLASFALYVRTLAPSLLYGDSAEFQTIAYTLGVGHPTGYPVYVLLAKLFTLLPFGEIAWRVNLFSAFCAALTVALVYLIVRRLGARVLSAVYGSLALAFIPLFWNYASVAEIYTPSAACLAIVLFSVLQWKGSRNPRWLFAAGLFGGLSLGIHTTVSLAAISILLYLILNTRYRGDWLQALFGAVLGLILFLSSFFLLDSLNSPAGYYNTVVQPSLSVWRMTSADFDSPFERLAFLYFPPQFRGQFSNVSSGEILSRLEGFWQEASLGLVIAAVALVSLFIPRRDQPARWREALLLILAFVTFLAFAVTYNVYDFYVYYIPATLVLSILVGFGVDAVVDLFAWIPKLSRFVPVCLGVAFLALGFYVSIGEAASHWRERIPPLLDDWDTYFYENPGERGLEAEDILNGIEDTAIVFTDWDYAYDYYYVAHILQGRTEMDFHETYPQEGVSQLADSAIDYIEANIDVRPIYFSERPSLLASKYKITRAAPGLFRLERK